MTKIHKAVGFEGSPVKGGSPNKKGSLINDDSPQSSIKEDKRVRSPKSPKSPRKLNTKGSLSLDLQISQSIK